MGVLFPVFRGTATDSSPSPWVGVYSFVSPALPSRKYCFVDNVPHLISMQTRMPAAWHRSIRCSAPSSQILAPDVTAVKEGCLAPRLPVLDGESGWKPLFPLFNHLNFYRGSTLRPRRMVSKHTQAGHSGFRASLPSGRTRHRSGSRNAYCVLVDPHVANLG